MIPVPPSRMIIPGRAMLPVSPRVCLSNIVTLMVNANHHPTTLRPLTQEVMDQWFQKSIHFIATRQDASLVADLFSDQKKDDFKNPMKTYLREYARIVATLLLDPEYYRDAGEELARQLEQSGDWEVIHVTSPALGYPRRYFRFKYEIGRDMPLFGTALGRLTDVKWVETAGRMTATTSGDSSLVQHALARTAWIFDRVYMDSSLVPEAKGLTNRDSREAFMGSVQAAQSQQRHLTAVPMLYLLQYAALWPRLVGKLESHAEALALELHPRDAQAVRLRAELKKAVLSRIPLHPLFGLLASVYESPLQLSTYYGTGDCIQTPVDIDLPRFTNTGSKGTRSSLAQMLVAAALGEELRLAAFVKQGAATASTAWVSQLLRDVAPNVKEEFVARHGAISGGTGYASLMEDLAHWDRYVSLLPDIARRLGWQSNQSFNLTSIEAAGGDFILTDGDTYSDSPVMALLGLRPCLPISNHKATGLGRRFATDFNTGPSIDTIAAGEGPKVRISWSTVTVASYVTALDGDGALAKYYMPAGMLMGEMGGEARFNAADISDPIGKRVADYYRLVSPKGFVRIEANSPASKESRVTPTTRRMYTDWDTYVESTSDPAAAQSELLLAYGADNVDSATELLVYRNAWNTRVPVQMSRTSYYYWLDELGTPTRQEEFDGHVAFNDSLTLQFNLDAVNALADMIPVAIPRLPDAIDSPVEDPEK